MLFLMLVSLYTSRVTLEVLGINDFGIYNAVGGVVAMFSILSGSLSAAISRFITYELGEGNEEKLKTIFSSALTIQAILCLLVLVFAETIGLWFLNVKMNIPIERVAAANWVFQFSILTFSISLISIPYNAAIISHERMTLFAYISVLEAIGKLLIAYLITVSFGDKLAIYSALICLIAFMSNCVYRVYCKRHFRECHYCFIWDRLLLKQMFGFAGWNFIGASAAVLRDQGGNIVINLFCGPVVNAARAIAFQVNGSIHGFVANFMTALNPQITKAYAAGENEYMMSLIFQGARLSFYMLLLLSLPVLVNTHYILQLWLNVVPDHTVFFVRLVLIFAMCESVSNPLITAMLATGDIKKYQIVVGGLQMMNLPVSYVLLRLGFFPEIILVVAIIISQCCLAARLFMLRRMIHLSVVDYLRKVYWNVLFVSVLSAIPPFFVSSYVEKTFLSLLAVSIFSLCTTFCVVFYIGCTKNEQRFILDKVCAIYNKISIHVK
ncbi:lipopolysaccharide biosynthesis protein [Parabacteroides sp.]